MRSMPVLDVQRGTVEISSPQRYMYIHPVEWERGLDRVDDDSSPRRVASDERKTDTAGPANLTASSAASNSLQYCVLYTCAVPWPWPSQSRTPGS